MRVRDTLTGLPLGTMRGVGISLSAIAWLAMLLGLAYCVMAAIENNQGELGRGLELAWDATRLFIFSFLLAAAGVFLWVRAERRLRQSQETAPQ